MFAALSLSLPLVRPPSRCAPGNRALCASCSSAPRLTSLFAGNPASAAWPLSRGSRFGVGETTVDWPSALRVAATLRFLALRAKVLYTEGVPGGIPVLPRYSTQASREWRRCVSVGGGVTERVASRPSALFHPPAGSPAPRFRNQALDCKVLSLISTAVCGRRPEGRFGYLVPPLSVALWAVVGGIIDVPDYRREDFTTLSAGNQVPLFRPRVVFIQPGHQ